MPYRLFVERYAQKQLMKLDKRMISVIKEAIAALADNPRPAGYIKLKGENAYRIRVGDYRVIYEINDNILTVTVITIGNRKNVYEWKSESANSWKGNYRRIQSALAFPPDKTKNLLQSREEQPKYNVLFLLYNTMNDAALISIVYADPLYNTSEVK